MISMKTMLATLLFGACIAMPAFAQEKSKKQNKSYPYAVIGIQGGGQITFTNYNAKKLITPIGAVSVGGQFTPAIGARLHVSGINEKGGLNSLGRTYDYKFVTTNFDLMLNLCNVFAPGREGIFNAYLIGGAGVGCAWDNKEFRQMAPMATESMTNLDGKKNWLTHNFRVGVQFEVDVCRFLGINLEVTANNYHDRFNSKLNGKGDWQAQGLIGLNFKIGRKKAAPAPVIIPTPVPEPEAAVEPEEPIAPAEPKADPQPYSKETRRSQGRGILQDKQLCGQYGRRK